MGILPQCFSIFPVCIFRWGRYSREIASTARAVNMLIGQARALATNNVFPRPEFFWKTSFFCSKHFTKWLKFCFLSSLFLCVQNDVEISRQFPAFPQLPTSIDKQQNTGFEFSPYMDASVLYMELIAVLEVRAILSVRSLLFANWSDGLDSRRSARKNKRKIQRRSR